MEEEDVLGQTGDEIRVSVFDSSIENHFNAMHTISNLCGEANTDSLEEAEAHRLSSSITFLREWKQYNYEPRIIKFGCETESSERNVAFEAISLPQFSSASVPKERLNGGTTSPKSSKDFVMNVGGPVWALDWCPRVHGRPDYYVKWEFVAVAAHPPESYYHKLGAQLTGRGIIQIWCVLNVNGSEEEAPQMERPKRRARYNEAREGESVEIKRPRGRHSKKQIEESPSNESSEIISQFKRPRGRPRKNPINDSLIGLDDNNRCVRALAIQFPEDSSELLAIEAVSGNDQEKAKQTNKGRKRKNFSKTLSACNSTRKTTAQCRKLKSKARDESKCADVMCPLLTRSKNNESSSINCQIHENAGQETALLNNVTNNVSLDIDCAPSIPSDADLPRIVLCLAHNGKVAWDVKWQPCNASNSKLQHRMGYLAVLLGNGSLEVWDVPLPQTLKFIYSLSHGEGTDPRFVKLKPVFRCSILKCGEVQSIPLTLEWSTSSPHDYLLAGCHDGMVALWKFSPSGTCGDTRPLLCFSAGTAPIRTVAWAPSESGHESANIILTAGHAGIKFWDIRDPFRPLWDIHPAPKFIYSLDWLPDPKCIILSFDDGTMRLLSLVKAAYDAPVNGHLSVGEKQHGLHMVNGSSFAIWCVQMSRLTGMVAYCSADGTVCRFQLTTKAVEKCNARNRAPHFICGSLSEDKSAIIVQTPLPDASSILNPLVDDAGVNLKPMQSKRTNDKQAKLPASDNQPLALCYGNDPGTDSESDKTLAALMSKRKKKSTNSMKKAAENHALVCREEGQDHIHEKESRKEGSGTENELMPPKIVAIHRVRWNMSKGSERWLCSGGAAGIVRCQEIVVSNIDNHLARPR